MTARKYPGVKRSEISTRLRLLPVSCLAPGQGCAPGGSWGGGGFAHAHENDEYASGKMMRRLGFLAFCIFSDCWYISILDFRTIHHNEEILV